jgi:hypothetical protein
MIIGKIIFNPPAFKKDLNIPFDGDGDNVLEL